MLLNGRYTNANVYASIIENEAIAQIQNMIDSPFMEGAQVAIMPDTHAGKGCTIGTTIQLDGKVCPNLVGVDIGCGMLVVSLGDIEINLEELDEIVNSVPSGFNVFAAPFYHTDYILNEIIAPLQNIDHLRNSIGTLGRGNHFIELNEGAQGKYLVIHSGSRNLGVQVCNYWQSVAQKNFPELGDLAYLEGENYENYLHDMKLTQEFASVNRIMIAQIILGGLGLIQSPILSLDFELPVFETIHNYIDVENGILRKGAVSAQHDEQLIIPINMRDGSLICRGKGNVEWNCSAPHGAGRILSRGAAKRNLSMEDFEASMAGIYSTSVCQATLDEAPMAYKPMEVILEDIKDTVDVIDVIRPIYNYKAH